MGKLEAPKEKSVLPDVEALMRQKHEREQRKSIEVTASNDKFEAVPKTGRSEEILAGAMATLASERQTWNVDGTRAVQGNGLEGLEKKVEQRQPSAEGEAGRERKHMRRKWFDVGHKEEKLEGLSEIVNDKEETLKEEPAAVAPGERIGGAGETEPGAHLELLSMDDIYRVAGIVNPRKGYSISKIVEMLHSEHLRGLSTEMKRASVLMALDAAGITVDEVLQDAKARQEAIDSYEAEQRKQFEA